MRWSIALSTASLLVLGPRASQAQRVVLLRPPRSEALLSDAFNRIQAELKLQAFELIVIEPRATDNVAATADAASEQQALAAVSLRPLGNGAAAELCIVDRATGKTSLRRLELENIPDAPALLAIRAVDLLRASLREFAPSESPPPEIRDVERSSPADARRVRVWARPARPRASGRLGLAWLGVASRIDDAYGVALALDYALLERLRLGLELRGPLLGARFESPLGVATLRQEMVSVRGAFKVLEWSGAELWPTAGIGLYHLEAHAEAVPPLVSKRDSVFAMLVTFGVASSVRIVERLMLEGELDLGLLTPRPGVAVLEHSAVFRLPMATATLAVRAVF